MGKNLIRKLYISVGRIGFWVLLPLMRILIRRTERVYLVLLDKDKVLLIKNWWSSREYHLPGGGVGRGEDTVHALIRELREELGYKLKPEGLKKVSSGRWTAHNLGFKYQIYITDYDHQNLKPPKLEITDIRWVSIKEAQELPLSKDIKSALKSI